MLRHGWNSTSFQTLAHGHEYFFDRHGCVAYVDTGAAWVAAGAPLVATERLAETTAAFVRAARHANRRCCFVATEPRFAAATRDLTQAVTIGEQPVWDPAGWTDILAGDRALREQLRRARAKGVHARPLSPHESTPAVHEALHTLREHWLATRRMSPMGFLVDADLPTLSEPRRCFVAEHHGEIVAVAFVIPVPRRGGWFIQHLFRHPQAPNGTVELLVDAVMRWAASEGSRWITLGLAPLAGDVSPWLRFMRRHTRFFYDFDGLRRFKAKFRPTQWHPIHVAHPATQSPVVTIYDVLVAFAKGSLVRFAWRTLLRRPDMLAVAAGLFVFAGAASWWAWAAAA